MLKDNKLFLSLIFKILFKKYFIYKMKEGAIKKINPKKDKVSKIEIICRIL
jgi:hypothetical protein